MKSIVLYAHPPEPDGLSIQGDLLYRGLLELNEEAWPCNPTWKWQRQAYYKGLHPDVAFGVGYWGNAPLIIYNPLRNGATPVPWMNADGWVANHHRILNSLPLMFSTSEWVRQTYKRDGVDVKNMVTMHIGIDTSLFKPMLNSTKDSIRKMLGIKDNEKMILTAGGDVTSKGAQEMFHALAQVDKEYKDWKYVCKSWPSDCADEWHAEEKKLVNELGIKDKVIFVDDAFSNEFMAHFLNAADIYAAPSRLEGFGMIQVEAMSCAKPVISINHMGPSETIIHNKTGFLAKVADKVILTEERVYPWMGFSKEDIIKFDEPKVFAYRADIDELVKFTLDLLNDEELCRKIGEEGRKHAVKNFDYHIISKKIRDVTKKKLGLD